MARTALLVVLIALTALTLGAWALSPNSEPRLGAWDEGPDGFSEARRTLEQLPGVQGSSATVATPKVLDELPDPNGALLVVAGVERSFTSAEIDAIARFQAHGGSLLLMTKRDVAGDLAGEYGILVDGREVHSLDRPGPRVTAEAHISGQTLTLDLFRPTSLGLVPNWTGGSLTVLSGSSDRSFIDVDGDGNITPDLDIAGTFPLAVLSTPHRGGPMVVVADPIGFSNALLPEAENRDFLVALGEVLLPDGGQLLFDDSRHAQPAGLATEGLRLVILVASGAPGWSLLVLLMVLAVAMVRFVQPLAPIGHVPGTPPLVAMPKDAEGLDRYYSEAQGGEGGSSDPHDARVP